MEGGDDELDTRQVTFDDLTKIQTLAALTDKEKRAARLLAEGCTQSLVADRMRVSRSFVSQTVTLLTKHNLVKKLNPGRYNSFYEIAPELKAQLDKDGVCEFSNCDTHYIKRKYRLLHKNANLSLDRRTGYMKSKKMRGWTSHRFWHSGGAGGLRVSIEVYPHSIVAYPDARQKVIAESIEQAEDRINVEIHNAVMKFVRDQAKFGCVLEIDEVGRQITPTHYAFPMNRNSPYLKAGTTQENTWTDGSPQKHGEPDRAEYETTDKDRATALDVAIDKVMAVEDIVDEQIRMAMPEAMAKFEEAFAPLKQEIATVLAYVQSGQTVQNQLQQLTFLVAKQLKEKHDLQDELAKYKGGQPVTVQPQQPEPVAVTPPRFTSGYTPSYED